MVALGAEFMVGEGRHGREVGRGGGGRDFPCFSTAFTTGGEEGVL